MYMVRIKKRFSLKTAWSNSEHDVFCTIPLNLTSNEKINRIINLFARTPPIYHRLRLNRSAVREINLSSVHVDLLT